MSSLADQVEQYGIELLDTHADLAGITKRHREDDNEAATECLVLEFQEQEKAVRDIQGFVQGELTIEYRSSQATTKDALETVVAAISAVLETAASRETDAQAAFSDLIFDNGGSAEASNTDRLRKRVLRVPMFARLATA